MNKKILARNEEIVIGTDVSDRRHNLAVTTQRGEVLKDLTLPPVMEAWRTFLKERLVDCNVTVVYEAGPHGYGLYEAIRALGREAVVVTPVKHVGVKTDARDARALARDWLAGRAAQATVPDRAKRVRRQVLRTRRQLVKDRTRWQNRLSAMGRFHGLDDRMGCGAAMAADPYLTFSRERLEAAADALGKQIAALDPILARIAQEPAYQPTVGKLTAIPGIGRLTALQIALEAPDMAAFKNSAGFASYTGLCPGEWSSGAARRQGHITRRGPGPLRAAPIQCAWAAVRCEEPTRARFAELSKRVGKKRAIVAIARRLAVRVWWALREPGLAAAA